VQKVKQHPTSPKHLGYSVVSVLAKSNKLPLFCELVLIDVDYKHSYRVV
jgi:hypothetical protein